MSQPVASPRTYRPRRTPPPDRANFLTEKSQVGLDSCKLLCESSQSGAGDRRAKAQVLGLFPAALLSLRQEDDLKMRAPVSRPHRFSVHGAASRR